MQAGFLKIKSKTGGLGSTLSVSMGAVGDLKIFISLLEQVFRIKF